MTYDIIGDIHGHCDELEALLTKMGYAKKNGVYTQSGHQVIFLGDYIDRGPKIRETLHLVKSMVDASQAQAIMGNHEFNALCYHSTRPDGNPLRAHTDKNTDQHQATLNAFSGEEEELTMFIQWFQTLPIWLELDDFRCVHAFWDDALVQQLSELYPAQHWNIEFLTRASEKGTIEHSACEHLMKGVEIKLPDSRDHFKDKDGHKRTAARVKWWVNADGRTKKEYFLGAEFEEIPLSEQIVSSAPSYPSEKPVFFGHYWLTGEPVIEADNALCLDYSVAKKGALVGYRFDGLPLTKNQVFIASSG